MAHDTTVITIYAPGTGRPVRVQAHQYPTVYFPAGYRKSTKAAAAVTQQMPPTGGTNDDTDGVEEDN